MAFHRMLTLAYAICTVARTMRNALPENAKISKEAKECMQECVSEFISFITSEGMLCRNLDQYMFLVGHVISEKKENKTHQLMCY